ncbi:hypothetical protein ES703_23937 [subsurface metagenome]
MGKTSLRILSRLVDYIARLSTVSAHIGIAALLAMGLMITADVVLRYVFNRPTQFTTEVTGYLMVAVTLLGLAYTLMKGKHIRIEVLTSRLRPRPRKILDLVTSIISLAFLAACIGPAWNMVIESYTYKSEVLGLLRTPLYLPQLLIPIGLCVIILQVMVYTAGQIKYLRTSEIPGSSLSD